MEEVCWWSLESDRQIQIKVEQQKQVESAATKLKPYLVRQNDGTFELNVRAADLSKLGVNKATLAQVKAGMQSINELIKTGDLTTDASGNVFFKSTGTSTIQSN